MNNPTPNVGDTITYVISLGDNGTDPATNVQVTDLLPSGLLFVSANASQGIYDSVTGLWTVGTVTTTVPQTLQIQAEVISPASTVNTATITHSDQFDPVVANNSATTTEDPNQADLSVTKTVDNATPNVGGSITYTITLTDNGPANATNVTLQDSLPAGLSFLSASPSQGTYNSASGIWTVDAIDDLSSATLTIAAMVVSPGPATNSVAITHADQFDPNPGNNAAGTTITPQQADLFVTKSVDNPSPNVGATITYFVTVGDNGPASATNVAVSDLLPVGLTFVSATPSAGTYDDASGTWTIGTVSPTTAQTLAIVATVASPIPQTNTATIAHSDQFDPVPANNAARVTVTPLLADLALAKSVSNPSPNVGDSITYFLTLTDNGPNAATNAQVTDLLPSGLSFVANSPSQGTYNPGTGVWNVGTVNVGSPATLAIQATVVSPNTQNNTATITHSDQFDPNGANNTASALVTPQQADLAISKTVSNSTPNVGDTITYTITVADNGPDNATNVNITDELPAGLVTQSVSPSAGSYNGATGIWTLGNLSTVSSQSLQVTALVTSPNPATNGATITHSDQFDPNTANNTASALVTPQQADLALAKTVSNPTPNVGDTITYTITLTDSGPDPATGVQALDALAPGLSFVSATPSQGTYDDTTGLWSVGAVDTATPQTLVIEAMVASPNPLTNTATITHSDQFDPNPDNDSAAATVTPQQADLALAKTTSNPTPNVGDTVTFTLTLTDNGPDSATDAQVTDLLPSGLSFVSDTASQGSYDAASGLWTVGTVNVGSPQTLAIVATITSANPVTNTAAISQSDQFDPNPANNAATAPTHRNKPIWR